MLFTPFDSVYSHKGHGNDQGQGPDYFIEKGVCISYVFVSHNVQLIFFLFVYLCMWIVYYTSFFVCN